MKSKRCFTLVEIMIAVAIIGLLFSFAVPAVMKVFGSSTVTRFVNDLKVVTNAFEFFNFENGYYPPDAPPGQMPEGMAGYLRDFPWGLESSIGGNWDWEKDDELLGAIAVTGHTAPESVIAAIDEEVDDGDPGAGAFTANGDRCYYVMK